jgi:outer membrane murein-binding lipoprotein Lpp
MLKKEDELNSQIADLQTENESLRDQIEAEKMSSISLVELKQNDFEK